MHALTHCRPLQPSELASNPAGHAALQQAIAQFDGGSIGELHSMQELECSLGIGSSSSGGGHARRSIPQAAMPGVQFPSLQNTGRSKGRSTDLDTAHSALHSTAMLLTSRP